MSGRFLIVHNSYQQKGGEDMVVEAEAELLRQHGHEVKFFLRHNDEIGNIGRAALVAQTLWSGTTIKSFKETVNIFKPDLVHVHNTFPLVSPSLYWAAAEAKLPVVQTLHNFRLLCPQAMLLRDGKICEDCVGKQPWRGIVRGCYRQSVAQSAVLGGTLMLHRALGTYLQRVHRYIVFTEFGRQKFIDGGLPPELIRVKPNFVESPPINTPVGRHDFLFVGRVSTEKGVAVLADAMPYVPELRCEVIGVGPEQQILANIPGMLMSGWQKGEVVLKRMHAARALVMPSICYEGFPRTLVEAFAAGLPVIASRLGAMAALIRDGETGLLFEPGNAADLAAKLQWAQANPEQMDAMGRAARAEYKAHYTPEKNYAMLMEIYADAIEAEHRKACATASS
jgi:glycosyltransferase involved in cell wall biosynthesis